MVIVVVNVVVVFMVVIFEMVMFLVLVEVVIVVDVIVDIVVNLDVAPWQTETIQYRRRVTGSLEWPVGFWKFWSSSLLHPRGRALAL